MPIVRGAVTFARFRAEPKKKEHEASRRSVGRALRAKAFEPIERSSDEDKKMGWVELEDPGKIEFSPAQVFFGEFMLVALRVDTLRVPAAVLKSELLAWSAKITAERGHPPKRSELKHEREHLEKKLRARAFIQTRTYDVSWNLRSNEVAVWAASARLVGEIAELFEECFEHRLHALSPGVAAERLELDTDALAPTPELFGAALQGVSHG